MEFTCKSLSKLAEDLCHLSFIDPFIYALAICLKTFEILTFFTAPLHGAFVLYVLNVT